MASALLPENELPRIAPEVPTPTSIAPPALSESLREKLLPVTAEAAEAKGRDAPRRAAMVAGDLVAAIIRRLAAKISMAPAPWGLWLSAKVLLVMLTRLKLVASMAPASWPWLLSKALPVMVTLAPPVASRAPGASTGPMRFRPGR